MSRAPNPAVAFRKLVDERCQQLRTRSFPELEGLARPRFGPVGEHVKVGPRSGTILTIVEARDDGRLRVVVRGALQWRFLPFAHSMAMDGFYKDRDGVVAPMPDEEFMEFD